MANLQKQLINFHTNIKLTDMDHNSTLREKRDIILEKLRERLKVIFQEKEISTPTFTHFNQGSYAMSTGVKPLKGDYDIDVGIRFNINKKEYDPYEVKKWVYEALKNHTKDVNIKNPCITIQYQQAGEEGFHVDLAIYAYDDFDRLHLARAPKTTQSEEEWQLSEPLKLISLIKNQFSDQDDKDQFCRIIRYLKRWKDLYFPANGNAAPVGIGLTIGAYNYFSVKKKIDNFSGKTEYNDLRAIIEFIDQLLWNFKITNHDGELVDRLSLNLPVEPQNDVLGKMSNNQMAQFKQKLVNLKSTLLKAEDEPDPRAACLFLKNNAFGDDFPVPEKSQTGEKKNMAFPPSSSSA